VKYWMDTEFIARPYSIDLISIGLVAEDGREFYAESSEVDWSTANRWTLENVRPQLDGKGTSRIEIGYGRSAQFRRRPQSASPAFDR
jgi:3' exoribonuclease, RNase T-like